MVNHGIVTDERSRDVLTAMPEAEWRKRTGPLVYFIGPTGGLIKIGRTENLRARLSQLRSANTEHLNVWACTYGTNLDESTHCGSRSHDRDFFAKIANTYGPRRRHQGDTKCITRETRGRWCMLPAQPVTSTATRSAAMRCQRHSTTSRQCTRIRFAGIRWAMCLTTRPATPRSCL